MNIFDRIMKRDVLRLSTFGGIGDVILTTPVIREWKRKYPRGKIIVHCTQKVHHEILRGNPNIDSLRLWWNPVLIPPIIAQISRRAAIFPRYSQLFPSISYKISAIHLIAEMIGIKVEDKKMELFLDKEENEAGRERIERLKNPIAIHFKPAFSANKEWGKENFEALVRSCPEYTFVQVGSRAEEWIDGAVDFRGLALRQSFSTIKHCMAFVGGDSGPAHAAIALAVPSVVIFGPSTPHVWGHSEAHNLYAHVRCSPCIDVLHGGECPYNRKCMSAISVEAVRNALHQKINNRSGIHSVNG